MMWTRKRDGSLLRRASRANGASFLLKQNWRFNVTAIGRNVFTALSIAGALLVSQGAWAQDDASKKRAELRKMCDDALAAVYKAKPEVKAKVDKAAGYGCFTSFGMSFFVGGAGGSGLVHSNATKKDTYMNMAQASGGLDFGIKDYREVLVFNDAKTLDQFIDKGWEFAGTGTAVAAAEGKGGMVEKGASGTGAIDVYPMTRTGLAVGVAATGRKYWKDKDLNAAK
jgi:lipid-binding SYLF domain-containing protein